MRDVLIACATREREENARRLIRAVRDTCTADTDLIFGVDDDDPSYSEDFELFALRNGAVQVIRGPRADVAEWTNRIAVPRAPLYRAVMSLGDDHLPHEREPRKPGWDELLLGALAGRPGVAYGNDLHQRERWPTAAMVDSRVIRALGYMCPPPPGPVHLCIDCFWRRLGEDLDNLAYLDDVIIEHLHPHAGKAAWDASYARSNAYDRYASDERALQVFLRDRWPDDLKQLRKALAA